MTRKKVYPQGYTSAGSLPPGTEPDKNIMSLASVTSGGDNTKTRRSTGSDKGLQKLVKRATDGDFSKMG
jgi:hypothetical protein